MATFSVRMPDSLKRRVSQAARGQGVSMNNFVVCAVATAAAQHDALMFFEERLRGKDREAVQEQFARIMSKTQKGRGPSYSEIDRLLGR